MKTCTKCKEEKPLTAFYADNEKIGNKRPDCKSCVNLRMKETRRGNEDYTIRFNEYQKEWQKTYRKTAKYKEWRAKDLVRRSAKLKEIKQQIVDHYGGQCACCGIKELPFLTVDHINNDGYLERTACGRRPAGYLLYQRIIRANFPKDLQVLCFNCNIAKQNTKGNCPHVKR